MDKCDHGVYIAAGDSRAKYCSLCNESANFDRPLLLAFKQRPITGSGDFEPRDLDAAEYQELPVGERLHAGLQVIEAA